MRSLFSFASFEPLEARRLMCLDGLAVSHQFGDEVQTIAAGAAMFSAGGASEAVTLAASTPFYPSSFSAKVNFIPSSDKRTFSGYNNDNGKSFGSRNNGLKFGWTSDNQSNMKSRKSSRSPNVLYDTFAQFNKNKKWEIAVPKGTYHVRYAVGDPGTSSNTVHEINVEGKFSLRERTNGHSYWIERSITVNVTDGKLTITTPSGSTQKLDWIEITGQKTAPAAPAFMSWQRSSKLKAPIGRVESTSIQIGTKLYILGGFTKNYNDVTNQVDVFDLQTEKWSKLPNLPETQTHQGIATDGKFIYLISGQKGTRYNNKGWYGTTNSYKFDLQKQTWSKFVSLPEVRYAPTVQIVNNKMYVIGGAGPDRNDARAEVWMLDLKASSPKWVSRAPMPFPGDHLSSVQINGKIYAVGGEHDHNSWHAQHDYMFEYNPSTNKWRRLANVPEHGSHMEGSTFVYNGKIWVVGGAGDGQEPLRRVQAYDPATNTWKRYTDSPLGRYGGVVGRLGNKLYYMEGVTPEGFSTSVDIGFLPGSSASASSASTKLLFNSEKSIADSLAAVI